MPGRYRDSLTRCDMPADRERDDVGRKRSVEATEIKTSFDTPRRQKQEKQSGSRSSGTHTHLLAFRGAEVRELNTRCHRGIVEAATRGVGSQTVGREL